MARILGAGLVEFGVILAGRVEDDLAAARVKLEGDPDQTPQAFFDLLAAGGRDIKEHKAAAPGAEQLAAPSAAAFGFGENLIHLGVGDYAAEAALESPGLVQEVAKGIERVVARQDLHALIHHLAHAGQLLAPRADVRHVTGGHFGGRAAQAGVKEHERAVQFLEAVFGQRQGLDPETVITLELNDVEPAERGEDLFLGSDGLADEVLLDMDGLRGELALGGQTPEEAIHGMKKPDRESRA